MPAPASARPAWMTTSMAWKSTTTPPPTAWWRAGGSTATLRWKPATYHNFGDFEQDFTINGVRHRAKLSADGYTLGVQGSYPVANKVDILGRAGWFFWDGEAEINNVSQASPEETNPYLGLGLSYALTESFSVNGDWTHYELESTNSDVFSIGFQFRFGQ